MTLTNFVYSALAVLCAGLIAFTMTPPVRVLAFRIGAVDIPLDQRRMHKKPIPRIGGLAIFFGFTASTMIFCNPTKELLTIWIGGFVLVALGILDDVFRLPAMLKFVVQIGAAVIAVVNGVVIDHISIGGNYVMFGVWRIPITILWIVGLTNAINLIDGLDGLACGVSAISSASLFCVVLLNGDLHSAMITAILTASCIGFMPFNKNPAKIFMGDTGALFLGFTLAVMSVQGVFKLHTVISFLVPLSIFALPLLDTTVAIIRRVAHGKSPFSPDRGHLHHKLVDMGFTQKNAVRILYAICALLGLVAVVFTDTIFDSSRLVKAVLVLILALIVFLFNYLIIKSPNLRVHTGLFDDEPLPDTPKNLGDTLKEVKHKIHNAEKDSADKEKSDGTESDVNGAEEKKEK
jgi:UDP-GlcNAc:undecaprenyl-phosphate GlcNAc-1-phosphate transferase